MPCAEWASRVAENDSELDGRQRKAERARSDAADFATVLTAMTPRRVSSGFGGIFHATAT